MNDDKETSQSSPSDGYLSLVAHIWMGEHGKLIRGTIEDVHTGTRIALDLSELAVLLQTSLAHSPGKVSNPQNTDKPSTNEKLLGEKPGEG